MYTPSLTIGATLRSSIATCPQTSSCCTPACSSPRLAETYTLATYRYIPSPTTGSSATYRRTSVAFLWRITVHAADFQYDDTKYTNCDTSNLRS